MLACQPRLSTIMDSQGAKSSCFHLNAINECRTKIVKIEQEKLPIEKSIQTLEDDIDEIDKFVSRYEDIIPDIVFEPIRSKHENLVYEITELEEQIEDLNEKLKELEEEIVDFNKDAKKAHCFCMLKN